MSKFQTRKKKKKAHKKKQREKKVKLLGPEVDYMVLEFTTVIRETLFTFIHVTILWT